MFLVQLYLQLHLFWMISCNDVGVCTRRTYLARAEQSDEKGHTCWDMVKVPTCAGRCDSREIADWGFPFRKSYHPVCVYGSTLQLVVKLRHCDTGVTAGTDVFHYVAAESCRCKVCSSQHFSCQWLPPNATLLEFADNADETY